MRAIGFHPLLRRRELVGQPGELRLVDAAQFAASCCRVTSSSSWVNCRCVFFQSRSKSSHTIQSVVTNRKMLDAAKTTFRKSML